MILLTGGNGFLGRYIYDNLILDFEVMTLSRSSCDYSFDLCDSPPVFNQIFDLVIHSAGLAHFNPKTVLEENLFFSTNVKGTENLLIGLERSGIPKKFVYISSVLVYGDLSGTLIDESFVVYSNSPFGKSKIEAENIILGWCKKNNVLCTILRLPLVLGCNPPGNLGFLIGQIETGFYFNLLGNSSKRSVVLASDVAEFIYRASEIGGIYNLTDGYHPTFNELAINISFQLGKGIPKSLPLGFIKMVARLGDFFGNYFPINSTKLNKITTELTFNDSKARTSFGWKPTKGLEGFSIFN
jgi:nucleoside-diphosphate-sugar epimerase